MRLRVVIIEDIPELRDLLETIIGEVRGLRLSATLSSADAFSRWASQASAGCDLALVNLLLKDGSGFTAVERCAADGTCSVIGIADHVDGTILRRATRHGAQAVFGRMEFHALFECLEAHATAARHHAGHQDGVG
jgi:DNA-binding NarL/FixJ family response regulator